MNEIYNLHPPLAPTDRARAYLANQRKASLHPQPEPRRTLPGPAITVSRQSGTDALAVAERVAELLRAGQPGTAVPWTVFDRQLMERTLEEHNLPKVLAEFIPEDHRSVLRDLMDEMLGIVPPPWEIAPKLAETVLHLAYAGHVILVGRSASLITARVPNVFQVRLVGSLARRAERLRARKPMTEEEALKSLRADDRARARYARANFQADVDDFLLYHLVINTDTMPPEEAAQVIAGAAQRRFRALAASAS
jgi:hypothetical protein